jgi:hypothetical protein
VCDPEIKTTESSFKIPDFGLGVLEAFALLGRNVAEVDI